jgi:hypothetical protein
MAQNRAVSDLARQITAYLALRGSVTESSSGLTLSGALKIRDELAIDGRGWQLWELSKEDADRATGGKP